MSSDARSTRCYDHGPAYPPELERAEAEAILDRRRAARASRQNDVAEQVGFGLSGGGIRSATFSLGVFQSLAAHRLVREIDVISTVSGGGYFGTFLGRLFTQDWIHDIEAVEAVLQGCDPADADDATRGWGQRVFRWLRENGRYLAPRGSGDLLLLVTILFRNWLAVQLVLVTSTLALFCALQLARLAAEQTIEPLRHGWLYDLLTRGLPGAPSLLIWSPWVLVASAIFVLAAVPCGWAYWLVGHRDPDTRQIPPWLGAAGAAAIGLGGTWYYGYDWLARTGPLLHPARLAVSAMLGITALGSLGLSLAVDHRREADADDAGAEQRVRTLLSKWLTTVLTVVVVVLVWSVIDAIGGTAYAIATSQGRSLAQWAASIAATFGIIGTFGRQLLILLAPASGAGKRSVPFSVTSWGLVVLVMAIWLVSIDVASHAIAWSLRPAAAPCELTRVPQPALFGADHLTLTMRDGQPILIASNDIPPCVGAAPPPARAIAFPAIVTGLLLVMTIVFGWTRSFANLSSIHAFYAARLTRTFLGAANRQRLAAGTAVNESVTGDDLPADAYWRWPRLTRSKPAPRSDDTTDRPWRAGAPLHIVNITVNETLDGCTGVQNQDRQGTGLALGPAGLSLGVRHHLFTDIEGRTRTSPPPESADHRVFRLEHEGADTPEALPVGRWVSISGAAFSAAAGMNTNVPTAMLCGMFNVRLGYWWNSGTPNRGTFSERLLPVQAALFAEMFARTRGTAGRLWNISDGGHFENMGGYELIRRRLPLIVIVDAEADPDYTYAGLSDLVRKARLDFNAEIAFLSEEELSGAFAAVGLPAQRDVWGEIPAPRRYFGTLDALRRGRWSDEPVPTGGGKRTRYTIEVNRARLSGAHAALARVTYKDDPARTSWLVYVKATMMGDEPADVCAYHRAHPDFPQEATADQFFAEDQWESYRRLGLHIGHRVLTPALVAAFRATPPVPVS